MTFPAAGLTYREVLGQAWPIILANAAGPLLGLSDTAVMGRYGTVTELGAIALGALVFNLAYWPFGFLRMATTGFVAQASGAADEAEVRATWLRACLMGGGLGAVLLVCGSPIARLALHWLDASAAAESVLEDYFFVRIWGAPAALGSYAVLGTLIGLGQSRALLVLELLMNGLNVALDILFVAALGWGARGIALGTAIAEWVAFLLGLVLIVRLLRSRHVDREPLLPWLRVRDLAQLSRTLRAHRDILIRTSLLLFGFAWFTQQGARFGDTILAANHVLLQFISFAAFFLDGYAFVAESLVGRAVGAKARAAFDDVVRKTSVLAIATSCVLAAALVTLGERAIALLTDLSTVRAVSTEFLPHAAVYIAVAVVAFQLDGIFIGATRTREMRNASIAAVGLFLAAGVPLCAALQNRGLWFAFILYVVARAVCLGLYYPRLRRALG